MMVQYDSNRRTGIQLFGTTKMHQARITMRAIICFGQHLRPVLPF
jgi:hypothetical protein